VKKRKPRHVQAAKMAGGRRTSGQRGIPMVISRVGAACVYQCGVGLVGRNGPHNDSHHLLCSFFISFFIFSYSLLDKSFNPCKTPKRA
jgi:hypothetical protein